MGILHASGIPCVVQAVQIDWSHTCVAVALDPRTGRLWWAWQKNMQGEEMARFRGTWAEEPAIDGRVWDGVRGHTGEVMQAVDAPQVVPPPYAPIRTRWSASSRSCAGPQGPRRAGPEGLAGRSGAGVATVRLGLDPEGPDNLARGHAKLLLVHLRYVHGFGSVGRVEPVSVEGSCLESRFDFRRTRKIAKITTLTFDVSAITLILGLGYSFVEIRGCSIGMSLRLVLPGAGDTQPETLNRGPGISPDRAARLHHEQVCGGAASPGRVAGRNHLARPLAGAPD